MNERGPTSFLFVIGIGLIVAGAAIYGILTVLGVSFAVGQASAETGMPLYMMFALPGLVFLGLLLLFIKVVADRLGSKEDDHYSKNVDK
ncbi:hypothetical protein [Henriciella mobilis]|uniref:Uncharacterized protein n=1 Tax=Henriciella mobilis TaxID=2305467 RepID=A0A399RAB4_9PROT|nr:hypothetical protein [Henriciella mobilis]RIJ14302.1 hypothetical protein D1231_16150 [Henriciella mobilis]RIJ19868.1 hypothetical protein D1227_15890 [Henriciella mobilis]RIJ28358.1 hypothetical protein D1223_13270 [Henriciella mobilis]